MRTSLALTLLVAGFCARACLAAEELIAMEGGISVGDPCEARAYHGFNCIERETIDAIKQWIRKGG